MLQTKKTLVMLLASIVLGGGAWYLNTTGVFDGISSSALTAPFVCTESELQSQKKLYERSQIRREKAILIRNTLTEEISQANGSDMTEKQDTLKKITKQILAYTRFIKKYDTCAREVNLYPSISQGVMSGEARVVSTGSDDYQELAAFEVASPTHLNTFLYQMQFQVTGTSAGDKVSIGKWFLLHENATPVVCETMNVTENVSTVQCDISADMPVSIPSGTRRTYTLAASITSVAPGAGNISITVSRIVFNEGRESSETIAEPTMLSYGSTQTPSDAAPVVAIPIVSPAEEISTPSGESNTVSVPVVVPTPPAETVVTNTTTLPDTPVVVPENGTSPSDTPESISESSIPPTAESAIEATAPVMENTPGPAAESQNTESDISPEIVTEDASDVTAENPPAPAVEPAVPVIDAVPVEWFYLRM